MMGPGQASVVRTGLYIDGAWCEADGGADFGVVNPATGAPMGVAASGGRPDADRAAAAASRAFGTWSRSVGRERQRVLETAAAEIASRSDELATILNMEHGKPLSDATKEIAAAADTFRYYAAEAVRIAGELAPSRAAGSLSLVLRQPIGPVAAITPWNYPVSLMAWKVAPAIAAGCTVVVKPPTLAPLTSALTAGIVGTLAPAGVVNVVTGPSETVGDQLIRSRDIRVIAFTGSSATGREIMAAAAVDLKHLILELGGHTPMLVFQDADLDRAVADSVKRSFRNAGQICNAVNRLYVERPILEPFLERFVELTGRLRLGDGSVDPSVDIGPLIDDEGVRRTQRHVDDALAHGASLLCGGGRPSDASLAAGTYFQPTVLADATSDMLVMREESFGPVVGVATFDGLDGAIEAANSTPYGLVTYAYTRDLTTAMSLGERVECGTVAINSVSPDSLYAPYPAWRQSGFGVELSHHGMHEYLQLKHVLLESH